jgi:monoamine oxidase
MTSNDDDLSAWSRQRRSLLKSGGAGLLVSGLGAGGSVQAAVRKSAPTDVLDIAIVGAGLAGLTAARDLKRAGCESFIVIEARDRVGGRTLNHDLGGGHISEVGGQWIGPGQTAIADLARELQVGTFPSYYAGNTVFVAGNGRVATDLHGGFGTDEKIAAKLNQLARTVPSGAPWKAARAAELDQLSLGDWLAQENLQPEDQISWNIGSLLSGGAMPAKMGLLHFLSMINSADSDYEQLDSIKHSAQETRIEGGSQILSLKMAADLGEKVRLSTPVSAISGWNEDVVTLHTESGIIRARHVILALMPSLCQQIAFDPPLPQGRRELQRHWPAHSPARKTVHVYRRPFWRTKGLNGQIIQAQGPVIWAYDNSPPDASLGVINAFVLQSMVPADPAEAERTLSRVYAAALGDEALHPIQYHDRDWGKADRWTLSCVSAIPPGFWTRFGQALHPAVGRLIWSGTETAEIWAGYMDGAIRSGHRAALQALYAARDSVTGPQ